MGTRLLPDGRTVTVTLLAPGGSAKSTRLRVRVVNGAWEEADEELIVNQVTRETLRALIPGGDELPPSATEAIVRDARGLAGGGVLL